jgi:hypothetical protein
MAATSAVDALLLVFNALTDDEQNEVSERIDERKALRLAAEENEMARYIRSLRRVAEVVGREPSVDDYRDQSPLLISAGEDVETFRRLYGYFGSWRRAREALRLAETTSARRIEARFQSRRMGKIARYTDETLKETLERCVAEYGHPPRVNEFEWWRERELELARAAGTDTLQLPSSNPYRKRWGTWERALAHFGFPQAEIEQRLEQG